MSKGWRALAAQSGILPLSTKPPEPPKLPAEQVLGDSGVLSIAEGCEDERNMQVLPDLALARDQLEERAAIREYDGGQSRAQAERAALADTARALGLPVGALRAAVMSN